MMPQLGLASWNSCVAPNTCRSSCLTSCEAVSRADFVQESAIQKGRCSYQEWHIIVGSQFRQSVRTSHSDFVFPCCQMSKGPAHDATCCTFAERKWKQDRNSAASWDRSVSIHGRLASIFASLNPSLTSSVTGRRHTSMAIHLLATSLRAK